MTLRGQEWIWRIVAGSAFSALSQDMGMLIDRLSF
jgi:hypothetical protein